MRSLGGSDAWGSGNSNIAFIGRRNNGDYKFNGYLYEFNIYDGIISEQQIVSKCQQMKSKYESE